MVSVVAAKELEIVGAKSEEEFVDLAQHRKQTEFVNIAAHEMKAHIQTILTYSEMLAKQESKNKKYVEPILRNAKRLQRIARNLLDLSRIENQSIILNKEVFDLSELVSSTMDDVVPSIAKNYQNLKLVKPEAGVLVNADKDKITQVICNLLTNAVKFTTSGTISATIEKRARQNQVVVSVKDSGLGINPHILPMLFSKFVSTSPDGLGLGLFITKSIVEAHGGKIWAQNNVGKGATFSFTIPL